MNSNALILSGNDIKENEFFGKVLENSLKFSFHFNKVENSNLLYVIVHNIINPSSLEVYLDKNRLIFQVGLEQHYSKPMRAHLLDRLNLDMLEHGETQIVSSSILLDPSYVYKINKYHFLLDEVIRVELQYEPDPDMNNYQKNVLKINYKRKDNHEEVF
jgi:hypothetical protein